MQLTSLVVSTLLCAAALAHAQSAGDVGRDPAVSESTNRRLESGFVQVDGGRLFYEAMGQGPVLLMTHDGLLHRESWNAQFAEFGKRFRVVRWDRRGFGASDTPNAPYSDLDDMVALTVALKIDRTALLACSAGGLLSLHFALDHPDKVSALVLVGPIVSGMSYSDHFLKRGGRSPPEATASVAKRIEYWVADPWLIDSRNTEAKQVFQALLAANPKNLSVPGRLTRWPVRPALEHLSQIRTPTLLVVGESDIPDVHAHVGAIEAGIAGSKRVVLARSGHLAHIEAPQEFNRIVLDFLSPK